MKEFKKLKKIIKSYMDKDKKIFKSIKKESLKHPKHEINLRFLLHFTCDEYDLTPGFIGTNICLPDSHIFIEDRVQNEIKAIFTCCDIHYKKGKRKIFISQLTNKTAHECPEVVKTGLMDLDRIKNLNLKTGYEIYVIKKGKKFNINLTNKIGENVFSETHSRHQGSYNPQMVNEYR
jgi:hypothetical protein